MTDRGKFSVDLIKKMRRSLVPGLATADPNAFYRAGRAPLGTPPARDPDQVLVRVSLSQMERFLWPSGWLLKPHDVPLLHAILHRVLDLLASVGSLSVENRSILNTFLTLFDTYHVVPYRLTDWKDTSPHDVAEARSLTLEFVGRQRVVDGAGRGVQAPPQIARLLAETIDHSSRGVERIGEEEMDRAFAIAGELGRIDRRDFRREAGAVFLDADRATPDALRFLQWAALAQMLGPLNVPPAWERYVVAPERGWRGFFG